MSTMVHFKLSPNEEARLLKEERERRRKLRIQQVREQSKINAAKVRQSVQDEKERVLKELAEQLHNQWLREKQEQLSQLESIYETSIGTVGEGHRQAEAEHVELQQECRELLQQEALQRAQQRHQAALLRLSDELRQRQLEEQKHILARQAALEVEKIRAMKVASLPSPPKDPVDSVEPVKLRPVKFTDRDAFSTSHYHISDAVVERATKEELEDNAKLIAELEGERLHDIEVEKRRSEHEQMEKARLRHKHAMEKESLKGEYNKLLLELSDLQRADVNRRRQGLERLPKQIFMSQHRHLEEKEAQQLNMERAFEDLYMKATEFTGDLSLALDPHPPPVTPAVSDSLDITTPLNESQTVPDTAAPKHSLTLPAEPELQVPTGSSAAASEQHPPNLPQPSLHPHAVKSFTAGSNDRALNKLFERIKNQRENWIHKSTQDSSETEVSAADAKCADVDVNQQGVAAVPSYLSPVHIPLPDMSEGTITDSTPSVDGMGSVDHQVQDTMTRLRSGWSGWTPRHREGTILGSATQFSSQECNIPPGLEEGTISSASSSMRSFRHTSAGAALSLPSSDFIQHMPQVSSDLPHEKSQYRPTTHLQENVLPNDVLEQRQHIEEERVRLEQRLRAIEDRQRQLEIQDKLISEELSFVHSQQTQAFESLEQPCHDRVDRSHLEQGKTFSSDKYVYSSREHHPPQSSEFVSNTSIASLPKSGTQTSTGLSNIRQYQNELLQRQGDRQRALLDARRHLQQKAQQLLDEGLSLSSARSEEEVVRQSEKRSTSLSFGAVSLADHQKSYQSESYVDACPPVADVVHKDWIDGVSAGGDVEKARPYDPEQYASESGDHEEIHILGDEESSVGSEKAFDADRISSADNIIHGDNSSDDEREFVTPELRADCRVRPCRQAEYTPTPHTQDTQFTSSPCSVPPSTSPLKSSPPPEEDFNIRILQARRDLEMRQMLMQEKLDTLENEEKQLAKQHSQIMAQLGNFSQGSGKGSSASCKQPFFLDPYASSSSDLLALVADGIFPSLSTATTPSIGRYNSSLYLPADGRSPNMSFGRNRSSQMAGSQSISPGSGLQTLTLSTDLESTSSRKQPVSHDGDMEQEQFPLGSQSNESYEQVGLNYSRTTIQDDDRIVQHWIDQTGDNVMPHESSSLIVDGISQQASDMHKPSQSAEILQKFRPPADHWTQRDDDVAKWPDSKHASSSPVLQSLSSHGGRGDAGCMLDAAKEHSPALSSSVDYVDYTVSDTLGLPYYAPLDCPQYQMAYSAVEDNIEYSGRHDSGVSRTDSLQQRSLGSADVGAGVTSKSSFGFEPHLDTRPNWEMFLQQYRSELGLHGGTLQTSPDQSIKLTEQSLEQHPLQRSDMLSSSSNIQNKTDVGHWMTMGHETGITDEPNLTLVSGVASADVTMLSVEKSLSATPGRSTTTSSSLMSFEQHEHSLLERDPSPITFTKPVRPCVSTSSDSNRSGNIVQSFAAVSQNAASGSSACDKKSSGSRNGHDAKAGGVRFAVPVDNKFETEVKHNLEDVADGNMVSLQDAFMSRRPDFMRKSEQRLAEVKEKVKASVKSTKQADELTQTIASWKKLRSINPKHATDSAEKKTVTVPTLIVESTSDSRKIAEKEMKERTKRFYSQLDEVKQRRAEEERRTAYAQNREKRKEYEKKLSKQKKASGKSSEHLTN